jgi:hypothetical protein
MTTLTSAIAASETLNEKSASLRTQDSREKAAAADFAAFDAIKHAGAEELWQLGKKPLAWGLGLGLPALGVGHSLLHGAKQTSGDILRDARNQALLTSLGVGGMQALGGMLQRQPAQQSQGFMPDAGISQMDTPPPGQEQARVASLIMVDDLLEDAYSQLSGREKSAALAHLVAHRREAMRVVRELLRSTCP